MESLCLLGVGLIWRKNVHCHCHHLLMIDTSTNNANGKIWHMGKESVLVIEQIEQYANLKSKFFWNTWVGCDTCFIAYCFPWKSDFERCGV